LNVSKVLNLMPFTKHMIPSPMMTVAQARVKRQIYLLLLLNCQRRLAKTMRITTSLVASTRYCKFKLLQMSDENQKFGYVIGPDMN